MGTEECDLVLNKGHQIYKARWGKAQQLTGDGKGRSKEERTERAERLTVREGTR